ncbi:MAG: NACHT domain-containing protein [Anaerolineae bacterium]|nr:NACHT domain-containing protein [Anaerolineae bacterium]
MVELGQLAFDLILNLLAGVIQEGANYKVLPYFERRRIERRIEDATAEVVEPLLPFLTQEKIPQDKQYRLIQTCVDELRPLTQNPERLFQGSLDGQKIFEELYANRDLPQVVIEDGLKDVYTLLCPRIATLLCKIPAAVKDWENEAWSENYRRLDEVTTQLRALFSIVDELAASPSRQADETLSIVRRSLAQKVRLELDLTGLRADRPIIGKFDDFFVHPEIKEDTKDEKKQPQVIGTPDDSFTLFTHPYRQAVVVGPAGAGKSTWANWLQRETLTIRWTGISVRVELRRFSTEPLLSLHELVREIAGKHLAEDLTAERIGHWLNAKQVIFILDGFDEIRPSDRDKVYDWIVDLSSAAWGCPFVLTSRPLTTDHLERLIVAKWQGWTVEPFDESRIVDYIQRWYAHTPLLPDDNRAIDAERLATDWGNDPTIEPLTGNPLLLSTLLMVHHLDGSLPSGRSQLYRRYVEGMLGLWDDRRQVSAATVQLVREQKRQITRGFALKLFFEEQDQLDEPATLEWLQEFLQKMNVSLPVSEVLTMLRERSGLIVGPGIYSFAHKSIAEYLVAEAVLQGDQRDASGTRIDRFSLFEHRDDDRWNTVTFLWAGLAPVVDVEAFIEECVEAKNWMLAYGILYDQYDRIPIDIRRRLLLQSITAKHSGERSGITRRGISPFVQTINKILIAKERSSVTRWGVSQPSTARMNLIIPTFELRGLVPYSRFHRVIDRATTDGTIAWSDHLYVKGEWRDLLWMCFARRPDDIDVWKACLASPCPASASPIEWLYWVAEYAFRRAITQETIDVEIVLATYQETCPQARGLVPIALMSNGLHLILQENPQVDHLTYERVNKLLKVLPNSDKGKVIPEWLLGTRDWILSGGERIQDLLAVFVEQMKMLVKQGHIERNETYESAIKFVRELHNRREALDVSTSTRRLNPGRGRRKGQAAT